MVQNRFGPIEGQGIKICFSQFFYQKLSKDGKRNFNRVSKLDKKNIYQCARFSGRPWKITLTSFGYFCLIFFFLLCTFPTLSHMLSYLQRIWSWRRREPRKRTGNVLWRVSHFLFYNSSFISFYILVDNVEEQWQVKKTELLFYIHKSKNIN